MSCDFFSLSNPGISGIAPYVPGKPLKEVAREFGLTNVVKLASNECPIGCSPKVREKIKAETEEIYRYPDGDGIDLKQALAEKLNVSTKRLSLGNGSNDLLEQVARVFAGPGKGIIYSEYAFAIYGLLAKVVGADGIEVRSCQWGHDLKAMVEAITDQTRVIYIANPNNPTGTWIDREQLDAFMTQIPEHVIVVLDEAYIEYVDHEDFPNGLEYLQRYPQLVVTRTFSKAYGLAGLRVGYSISHPQVADLINRVRQPFNVNLLAQSAAIAALQDEAHVQRAVQINTDGKKQLVQYFESMRLEYIPSFGNFISVDVVNGDQVYDALLRQGVIVRPMRSYQMPRHIRVTIGTQVDNEQFISALKQVIAKAS